MHTFDYSLSKFCSSLDKPDSSIEDIADNLKSLSISVAPDGLYDCNVCGAHYKKPWTLKNHQKKKHGLSDSAPQYYVCEECQEVFLSEDEKEVHARVHLTCHICKRVCKDKKGFNRHLKSHKV